MADGDLWRLRPDEGKGVLQGAAGPQGPVGPIGPQGFIGLTGPVGLTGLTGPIGLTGPQGIQGLVGPTGLTGAKGDQGVQGVIGPIGLTGPQGIQGIQGAGVTIKGSAASPGALPATGNVAGDTYIMTGSGSGYTAGDGYSYTGSAFLNVGQIRGPMGPQGIAGAAGAAGAQGIQGVAGAQGPQGTAGATGAQGPQGATGATGTQGVKGDTGSQGLPGAAGQCQFNYISATQCRLDLVGGGLLVINGVAQQIPVGGISISNNSLAALTEYYIYAFMNGSNMALEAVTTAFSRDTKGVPIKGSDSTRTCVGWAYTDGSGQFQDTLLVRGVATYFNRFFRRAAVYQSGAGTSSTTPVSGNGCACFSWGTDTIAASVFGYAANSVNSAATFLLASVAGMQGPLTAFNQNGINNNQAMSVQFNCPAPLGKTIVGPLVFVGSGYATYSVLNTEVNVLQ